MKERFVAGMSWSEMLHARILGAALMIPVARHHGGSRHRSTDETFGISGCGYRGCGCRR
ncbi:hypothetical protein [Variovorax sp. N23]|uniref:hypothetical protein n=1 Tax=Variovorax sp. N23 TaxID=2980555 RepID=UPI0021C69554|nr:hypothetical protein [Variovorax sp. N23]MCU4120235.1 hypothetical protein [Variovorax sp. N23]